ncbi:MAG: prenyltransferase/squalene oxidase repeat-containing protein [Thermofilaceae archaeon]
MSGRFLALVDVERIIDYVLSKRGNDGGYLSFQYMNMFESSAEDTFYALSILSALDIEPPGAENTINFLQHLQDPVKGYRSVEVAYYSVLALSTLGAKPRDPQGAARLLVEVLEKILREQNDQAWFVLDEQLLIDEKGVLRSKDATSLLTPADVTPRLHRLSMIVCSLSALNEFLNDHADTVAEALLQQRCDGGGFGYPAPLLESTYWAIKGLEAVASLKPFPETIRWVLMCENDDGGFSTTPHSRNYFIENIYYGLQTLRTLGSFPRYTSSHVKYVSSLQNANGGFRRAPTHGASSLEYTYYAVHSMKLLNLL